MPYLWFVLCSEVNIYEIVLGIIKIKCTSVYLNDLSKYNSIWDIIIYEHEL